MAKDKFAHNSAEVETSNGEITFIAARSVENLNGWTYDVKSLQAQNSTGDYQTLTTNQMDVSIPLMVDHSSSIHNKVGTIDKAWIVSENGEDRVEMHAKFFKSDEAQEVRQRVLDGELTDVSITTDWGTSNDDTLENAHIIEVSVVYAGAEPKAKILAKNSVDNTDEEEVDEGQEEETPEDETETPESVEEKAETEEPEEAEKPKTDSEEETEDKTNESKSDPTDDTEDEEEEEEEEEMATQPITQNDSQERVATKEMVLNALVKLAKNDTIRGLNRSEVIEAVRNEVTLTDADGDPYVVPDAVFTEILAINKPTDILQTFATVPAKSWTVMAEQPSEEDLARAGRWSKGQLKAIQESDLAAQALRTQFLYKMQEISYEDLQQDFGDLLYNFIRNELPQKVSEEEERDFIVGDGRATNAPRHISSIVSLDAAAEDTANVHVLEYDGTGDASVLEALINGVSEIEEEGATYAVMRKATLTTLKNAGLSTASGLPFTAAQVAEALEVDRIFVRKYVPANTAYAYVGSFVKRLTGGNSGETIEQYDIDYNNRKIEFIRPVGGAATGLASAVKINLPTTVSA